MIEVGKYYTNTEIFNFCIKQELFDLAHIIDQYPPDKSFKSDGCSGPCPQVWKGISIQQL